MQFSAVQAHLAKLAEPVGLGYLQDLYEQCFKLHAESVQESGQGAVVPVGGEITKGQRVAGGPLAGG